MADPAPGFLYWSAGHRSRKSDHYSKFQFLGCTGYKFDKFSAGSFSARDRSTAGQVPAERQPMDSVLRVLGVNQVDSIYAGYACYHSYF